VRIGVLGLQGDYLEHHQVLRRLGVETVDVRLPQHLEGVDGLIIPGGESTTIGALAERYGLMDPLRRMAEAGKPIWGTCAGMIFLAKDVGRPQPTLGLMDIRVRRNAFGRQIDSFEVDLEIPALARLGDPRPFHAVFIRAPLIEAVGPGVEVLALEDGSIVAAQQGHLLATAFHPELTEDTRFHRYFLELVRQVARG
jgi:5'-phosphate synthase pdxT subunit